MPRCRGGAYDPPSLTTGDALPVSEQPLTQAEAAAPAVARPAARPRIFYGWWIVLGAIVAQFVAVGVQGQVSGVFLRPMSDDLGWTRAQFTIAASLGTGVAGALGFFIGATVDRLGARPLMVVGVTIVGGGLIAISRVEELWQFIVLRGLVFTVGFVLIGNLVVNVAVSKWFVERRGWAISLASLGVSAAGMVVPVLMVRVVDEFGWRDGWVVMGVAAWVLVYPVALIMRRQPEDHGLLPDGKIEGAAEDAEAVEAARLDFVNSYTRGEAVRTGAMWLLVLAFGLAMVGLISLLFHSIPFLTDAGFGRSDAALMVGTQGAAALASKFAWGWAMQRFHPRGLAALSFLLSGGAVVAMVPIARAGSLELMFAAFAVWGWGIGGMIPLSEFIWASFFGRRHLGAVRGAGMPLTIAFSAAGPFFAGLYFDAMGSYDGALLTFASLWGIAALLVLMARQPAPKAAAAATVRAGGGPEPERPAAAPAPAAEEREQAQADAPAMDARPAATESGPAVARPPAVRPGAYLGETKVRAAQDYMRQQLVEGRDSSDQGPAFLPAGEPDEPAPSGELPAGPAAAADGPVTPSNGGSSPPGTVRSEDAPHSEDAPDRAEPPAGEFIPFEELGEPAPGRNAEPPDRLRAEPAFVGARLPVFDRPTPVRRRAPAATPRAVERSVNLGQASRALQRRVPMALAYYRRDGVASAVWAGVAASVAVTTVVWLLSRNGKSPP